MEMRSGGCKHTPGPPSPYDEQRERGMPKALRVCLSRKMQEKQRAEQSEAARSAPEKKKSNRLGYMETRELAALPEKIEALEAELAKLKQELDDPQLFATKPTEAVQKTEKLAELEQQLEQLVDRWAELAEREGAK